MKLSKIRRTTFCARMKQQVSIALLSAVSCGFLAGTGMAQENKTPVANVAEEETGENFWLTLNLPLYSSYFYRGIELYSDTSFQPSLSTTYDMGSLGNVGASVWAHIPVGKNQNRTTEISAEGDVFNFDSANEFVELDPSLYYFISIDKLTLSVGHIWYTDPHKGSTSVYVNGERVEFGEAAPNSAEFFGTISIDTYLQPTFTVYHDYRRFDYQYYALSFSQRLDSEILGTHFGDQFNLTPYVLIGGTTSGEEVYNDPDGIVHINAGLRSTFQAGSLRVTPSVQFNFGMDDKNNGFERTKDDLLFGIDVAYDAGFKM